MNSVKLTITLEMVEVKMTCELAAKKIILERLKVLYSNDIKDIVRTFVYVFGGLFLMFCTIIPLIYFDNPHLSIGVFPFLDFLALIGAAVYITMFCYIGVGIIKYIKNIICVEEENGQ